MSESTPRPWIAAGNDYRGVLGRDPVGHPPRMAVAVDGDGSDVDAVTSEIERQDYEGDLAITTLRDLGETGEFDVVVFLARGDIPGPGWLAAHARWHARASNLVVLGPSGDEVSSDVIRRTRQLLGNDEAFTAMTNTNMSIGRAAWHAVSRLDIVGGWRLWNDGCFFAFDPEARLEATSGLERADTPGRYALEDVIPHRRYRPAASQLHGVPRVSMLAAVSTPTEAASAWGLAQESVYPDMELILFGPDETVAAFTGLAEANQRVTVVAGEQRAFHDAVLASRGELLALVSPPVTVAPEIVTKAVARFDQRPNAPLIRVGYELEGGRFLRLDDLAAIDEEMGRGGLPYFAMTTRRELLKNPAALLEPGQAWSSLAQRCDQSLVVSPVVSIAGATSIEPRLPGIAEAVAVGAREVAVAVVREARRRRASAQRDDGTSGEVPQPVDRVSVAYVGFTGHDNLGDEAVRVAIERLMPWAEFQADPAHPRLLMVGGGTLLNGRRYYLTRMLRQESASVERALFGTGVRSPAYWGVTEPMDDWFTFIDSCLFAAVRGPDSVENLRTLGYGRNLPIIGDPALSLIAPPGIETVPGRVVVCPVFTNGNLHGGSDTEVFDAIATLIRRSRSEGREVVMLSAFPADDRWVIDIMRRAGSPDLEYVAGYADIDETMHLLASAEVVVAERLHAAIMAAAAGTPFVGLEYRPKLRDFARSIDQEAAIVRTDQIEELGRVFDRVTANRETLGEKLVARVSEFRALQADAAERLRSALDTR